MKLYQVYLISAVLMSAVFLGCSNDENNEASFGNKIYIDVPEKAPMLALKNSTKSATKSFQLAVAKPVATDVDIVCKVDESLVATYNSAYYAQAVMLPAEFYDLPVKQALLAKGTVRSTVITVNFKALKQLSRDKIYVLPVTIESANGVDILSSARTLYYVLKSAASINVVADMEKTNYVAIPSFKDEKPSSDVCNNLNRFTLETLIRVRDFKPGIQTVMGAENGFLLRISDNGLKPNQLQFVTPSNKLTSDKCLLQANQWIHIAATFDVTAKQICVYINGELAVDEKNINNMVPANLAKKTQIGGNPFLIGYSCERGRELDGEICECRIWNVVRTPEELLDNLYEVEPNAAGLVAYWKFDEGNGQDIQDYTGNGNNGKALNPIKWTPVTLPAPAD